MVSLSLNGRRYPGNPATQTKDWDSESAPAFKLDPQERVNNELKIGAQSQGLAPLFLQHHVDAHHSSDN